MRLGVFTASPIAPFLGAVQIPLIHLLKLVVSNVAPLSQLPIASEQLAVPLVSPDWLFRHTAAFAIEERQYSEPIEGFFIT